MSCINGTYTVQISARQLYNRLKYLKTSDRKIDLSGNMKDPYYIGCNVKLTQTRT